MAPIDEFTPERIAELREGGNLVLRRSLTAALDAIERRDAVIAEHVAKMIGAAFEAIDLLQLSSLISDTEARKACMRLRKKAEKIGLGIAITDTSGARLFRQIRVHWMDARGVSHSRLYPHR